jgi:mono/diheme cytochrome c family protein/glucose/arabinose dehydrogenase
MLNRILLASVLLVLPLHAQLGDRKDAKAEKQIAPVPPEWIPPAPVLHPEAALKSFKLQPGFRIELVASEPLVHDPVAMTFGPDGRIWVVEMSNYMPDVDGHGEEQPLGKIAILEDTDGDGKMDKRTVFAEHLLMPHAISLVRDGVLVAEPPHLWFYPIIDGNKAGERTEIAKDYGNQRSPEHTANGLLWAQDNWIYSADYPFRFRNLDGDWQRDPTTARGQFGISQDDFGRLVYNHNSDQFRIDLVPSAYLQRNPNYRDSLGLNVDPIRNQTTWPIRVTPGVNRGYRQGILRPDGTLANFTACCSPLIYRGDNFPPDFSGNAFTCEPTANLIKRNVLMEGSGTLTGYQAYTNAEFLASTDERFRPVGLNNGPDGALYVVDFYRGIIEHRIFVTTYLREQIKSRGLEQPLGLGRIYRIVHGAKPTKELLATLSSAQLVEKLSHPNGWVRDIAQRLLVERSNPDVIAALKKTATTHVNPLTQIHALWTLDGMGQIDRETVFKSFSCQNPKVRATAIRLSEPFLKTGMATELLSRLVPMAESELHPDIQLQLAFTLGQSTEPEAERGLLIIAKHSAANPLIREAMLSGLGRREVEFLNALLHDNHWVEQKPGREALLDGLAQCLLNGRKTNDLSLLLEAAAAAPAWQKAALLDGLAGHVAVTAKRKSSPRVKPVYFVAEPRGFAALRKKADKETLARLAKIDRLITWPGQPGYRPPPKIKPLTAPEQKRFAAGQNLFAATCAGCHQLTGLGQAGLAPPLVDSEWVLGSEQRLARIVLHGVHGEISVKGRKYEMEMPGLGTFDDEQIASVLTYIRREWEHAGAPVNSSAVKKIRSATAKREEAWSEKELLKIR